MTRKHPLALGAQRLIDDLEARAKLERRRAREAQIRAEAMEDAAFELAKMLEGETHMQVVTCDSCKRDSPPPDEHLCADCDEAQTGVTPVADIPEATHD